MKLLKNKSNKEVKVYHLKIMFITIFLASSMINQAKGVVVQKIPLPKDIQVFELILSPDGKRCAVTYKKDDKFYVTVDGNVYGGYESGVSQFHFYHGGNDFWFLYTGGEGEGGYNYNLNGKESPGCYYIVFCKESPAFGVRFHPENDIQYVNVMGTIYGGFNSVSIPVISGNEKVFAFSYEQENKYYINFNGKITGGYRSPPQNITLSWDGTQIGYTINVDDFKEVVIINNVMSQESWQTGPIVFSKTGKSYGYSYDISTHEEKKVFAVINGKTYGPYFNVDEMVFSGDGHNWAFCYTTNQFSSSCLLINDRLYENAFSPFFSEKGDKYGFVFLTNQNERCLNLNGKIYGPYENIDRPFYSPDAKKTIINAEQGILMDGTNFYYPINNDIQFSPNGKYYAYSCMYEGSDYSILAGGKEHIIYNVDEQGEDPYPDFTISRDNRTIVAYIKDNEIVIEDITPP